MLLESCLGDKDTQLLKNYFDTLLNDWLNWDAAMRRNKIIEDIERTQEKELPEFNPGDTVSVSVRVKKRKKAATGI